MMCSCRSVDAENDLAEGLAGLEAPVRVGGLGRDRTCCRSRVARAAARRAARGARRSRTGCPSSFRAGSTGRSSTAGRGSSRSRRATRPARRACRRCGAREASRTRFRRSPARRRIPRRRGSSTPPARTQSSVVYSTPSCAPCCFAASTFASVDDVTNGSAPMARAIETAVGASPPPAPRTSSDSPRESRRACDERAERGDADEPDRGGLGPREPGRPRHAARRSAPTRTARTCPACCRRGSPTPARERTRVDPQNRDGRMTDLATVVGDPGAVGARRVRQRRLVSPLTHEHVVPVQAAARRRTTVHPGRLCGRGRSAGGEHVRIAVPAHHDRIHGASPRFGLMIIPG